MDNIELIDKLFANIESKDDKIRYRAFQELLQNTDNQVSWIYDKWFLLVDKLSSGNSYQRSIALMLLANLSKSDSENRFSSILDKYLVSFEDEKFITSRQCIQNIWKIALVNDSNKEKILRQLERAYFENIHLSKHGNLIKQDVIYSLDQIYKGSKDETIKNKICELIENETDTKLLKILKRIIG